MTEESLPHKLLKDYWWDVIRIPIGQLVMQMQSYVVLSIEGNYAFGTDLGLIMQWSGVAAFQSSNDAMVKFSVIHIRSVYHYQSTQATKLLLATIRY